MIPNRYPCVVIQYIQHANCIETHEITYDTGYCAYYVNTDHDITNMLGMSFNQNRQYAFSITEELICHLCSNIQYDQFRWKAYIDYGDMQMCENIYMIASKSEIYAKIELLLQLLSKN